MGEGDIAKMVMLVCMGELTSAARIIRSGGDTNIYISNHQYYLDKDEEPHSWENIGSVGAS